jgi:hypothetical protein
VLIRGETSEGLEALGEVIGADEVGEVASKLVVALVIEALDGCLFYPPIHAFHLPVGPWMLGLGEAIDLRPESWAV